MRIAAPRIKLNWIRTLELLIIIGGVLSQRISLLFTAVLAVVVIELGSAIRRRRVGGKEKHETKVELELRR